ncbi:ZNF470 [Symbiodinium necroappetens]|uniref:ZNF470 protein n=1 Tax=Symbiodinium necroappetens TaxID=1628268 RepID=A0A812UNS2_9DINO|nr:ZNF470 [Symbiodinium necroappetens]
MARRKKRAVLAGSGPEVLLLGEANFSFALALLALIFPTKPNEFEEEAERTYQERLRVASAYLQLPPEACRNLRLTATCYESYAELVDKYPETVGILSRIRAFGEAAEVRFAVDALQLESWQRKWDVVAWNHPHLGTEDLKLHGCLLAHFLDGAAKSLRPNGVVVLALLEGQERRWQLLKHAQAQRFDLAESPFELTAFAGYECKRNSTGKSFQSLHVQKTARAAVRSRLYHLRWNVAGQGDVAAFDAMEVHELLKYADRSESLKCESCGRAFRDSEALTQHRQKPWLWPWLQNLRDLRHVYASWSFNERRALEQHQRFLAAEAAPDACRGLETLQCCTLSFVEALLDFAKALTECKACRGLDRCYTTGLWFGYSVDVTWPNAHANCLTSAHIATPDSGAEIRFASATFREPIHAMAAGAATESRYGIPRFNRESAAQHFRKAKKALKISQQLGLSKLDAEGGLGDLIEKLTTELRTLPTATNYAYFSEPDVGTYAEERLMHVAFLSEGDSKLIQSEQDAYFARKADQSKGHGGFAKNNDLPVRDQWLDFTGDK